jgi:hypothetical protein
MSIERITAEEFVKQTLKEPSWSWLKSPLQVTGTVDLKAGPIKSLSPHLEFLGETDSRLADKWGRAADFSYCKSLKSAEGTFHGYVDFSASGVEEIGSLTVKNIKQEALRLNRDKGAASFYKCKSLKVAKGYFECSVDFESSGIEKITELYISNVDRFGGAAYFTNCKNLKVGTGFYPGFVSFEHSGITQVKNLKISEMPPKDPSKYTGKNIAVSFKGCTALKYIPIDLFETSDASEELKRSSLKTEEAKKRLSNVLGDSSIDI